ncbi:hypothetical protein [Hansschlegelia plantiphila]|uniref:Uncharacterized protein n=1 Tax=Hansschlegelia plantiphila TaxID=374655 RepID=A0A9W6MUG3_9HYPH|nr:hypothetical protein [Hansschlegelia plantiphila]GLK66640.1 hypothetical protein GCM10008179_02780 [Hansschlegelia plantiphila]
MIALLDCLADFSVAALINAPQAEAKAAASIDDYLARWADDPRGQLAAARELRAAFLELSLDSRTALAIRDMLDERIAGLSDDLTKAQTSADRPAASPA